MKTPIQPQLRIAYLKELYSKYPHGYFGTLCGDPAIIVTYDPKDPKVTSRKRKRFRTHTKKGQEYASLISKANTIKCLLDKMLNEWNSIYRDPPFDIKMPIKRTRKQVLSREFFKNAKGNQNPKEQERPIYYKGNTFRSKNDLINFIIVEEMGYECKYEVRILLPGMSNPIYPDAMIYAPEVDAVLCMEIDGAMDDPDYMDRSENKRKKYIRNGFVENKDVIYVRLWKGNEIDVEGLRAHIMFALENQARDVEYICD